MLFLPPRPPVALPARGCCVLGRSRSCDLTLTSPDASRRHAEIAAEGGRFLLRDLGSTNGTWVNGERVGERVLESGDRIDIGGEILTFCEVDAGLEVAQALLDGRQPIDIGDQYGDACASSGCVSDGGGRQGLHGRRIRGVTRRVKSCRGGYGEEAGWR